MPLNPCTVLQPGVGTQRKSIKWKKRSLTPTSFGSNSFEFSVVDDLGKVQKLNLNVVSLFSISFSYLVNYDVCSVLGRWKVCEFVSEILS